MSFLYALHTVNLSLKSLKFVGIFEYMKLAGFHILSISIVKMNKQECSDS